MKMEWLIKISMALGTLRKYISPDIIFHIDKCKTITESWDKLEKLYVQVDKIRCYTLEGNLLNWDPKFFDTIQGYATRENELKEQCKDYAT